MAHKWFAVAGAAFFFATLTACNRGDDKGAEPKVVELPVPAAVTTTAPSQAQAQPTEVKRYGAQEQTLTGSVRVTGESVKAYPEPDNKGQPLQELAKSTLVERKASFGEYSLVAYPTPKGDTDLGWVLTSDLADSPESAVADTTVKKAVQTTANAVAAAKSVTDTKTDKKSDKKADTKSDKKADTKSDKKADTKSDKKADTKSDKKADTKSDKKADTKSDEKKADAAKTAEADAVKKAADDAAKAASSAAKAAADALAKSGATTSTSTTSKKK